jgi:hypothetical protein
MLTKYKRFEKPLIFALAALWVIGYSFLVGRAAQHQEDRKQIEIAHKSGDGIKREQRPQERNPVKQPPSYRKTEDGGSEATDVTFVGLKLGEAMLVFVTVWLVLVTRDLVRGAENTAKRQLRAYVFLDPAKEFTFVRRPSTTATVEVEIHVKNLGLTPAHDVVADSWMTVGHWTLAQEFMFTGPPGDAPHTRSVVPPGGSVHFHTGTVRPFTPEELSALENGELRVYIYGQIRYNDAFNRPHWTNFCQASTALGREGFTTAMAKTDRHNDADTD